MVAASLTIATGIFHQAAVAAEIEYNPVSDIPEATWSNSAIGQYAFSPGDSVSFYKPAVITLANNIQASVVNVREHSELVLIGDGNSLTATTGIDLGMNTILTLRDNALAAATKLTQSSGALVRLDWGDITSSIDTTLAQYRGAIAVLNSTFNTTPAAGTAWDRLVMEGASTLQLGSGSVLNAPVTFEGDNTVMVASGTATINGEISGYGTITKTGTGTLVLDRNDEVYSGDLIIDAGTVQWGEGTACFRTVVVNAGATYNDARKNVPLSVRDITGVVLNNGGRMTGAPAEWIVYKSLEFNGSGTLEGNRRFGMLTGTGTLTVGTGTTRFEYIKDVAGTINGSATRLMIDTVDLADGITLNVAQAVRPDTLTKIGQGTLNITSGGITAENDLVVKAGTMNVNGAVTDTNSIFANDAVYKNTGNMTSRGYFSLTGNADVTVTGSLTAGTLATLSTRNVNGHIAVQPTLQMAGKALHVTGTTTATGNVAFASGVSALDGNLTAQSFGGKYASQVDVTGAGTQVTVGGALQAGSLNMAGQSLGIGGNMAISGNASLTAGTTTAGSVSVKGDLAVNAAGLVSQGALSAGNVLLDHTASLTAGSATIGGSLVIGSGSSAKINGAASMDVLDAGGSLFQCSGSLAVRKMLTMSYNGDFSYAGNITLGNESPFKDIVLSYVSGRQHVNQLSAEELHGFSVIYIDISRVSEADLRSGIDLGIGKSAKEKLSIAQLQGGGYTIDDSGATLVLRANSKTSALYWDANWGTVEVASAPAAINELKWDIITEKEGLFRSPYYDNNSYLIAANVKSSSETPPVLDHDQLIFGGAYSPQTVDPESGTIERDIWLNMAGGDFTMVVGGSLYGPGTIDGRTLGRWNLAGDTHVQITSGMSKVGSVMGSNFLDGAHTGNSYVSVYSSKVFGSVFGSIYGDAGGSVHTGDTHVYVYTNQPSSEATHFVERTMSEEEQGAWERTIDQNAVVGGGFSGNGTANMVGDTHVVFDFSTGSSGNTVKNVVGGHWGGNAQMTGNSNVAFIHMNRATFSGDINTSGHYGPSGNANQQQTGDGNFIVSDAHSVSFSHVVSAGHATTVRTGSQTRTGDSNLLVTDSGSVSFSGVVAGDHYWSATAPTATQTHSGNTTLVVQNTDGVSFGDVVTAGSYLHEGDHDGQTAGNVTQTNTGNTTFLINNCKRATFSGPVANGGSYAYLSDEMPATLNQSNTGAIEFLILNSPGVSAQAAIIGGHYACDTVDEPADPRTTPRTTITQAQNGEIQVSIANAENSLFYGDIVAGHYATCVSSDAEPIPSLTVTQTQTGNSSLNILNVGQSRFQGDWLVGGHFNNDIVQDGAGGVRQTHATGSINVNINSGIFSNKVVGGDVEDTDAESTSTISGDIQLNLSNAQFANEVVGGSYGVNTASVNDITINASNSSFTTLIGGHNNCGGTAGNITLNLTNTRVSSALYGGSIGNVRQGEVVINLKGGSYRGVIYAGGDATRSLSTRLDIADNVELQSGILISGGYPGLGPGRVTGARTLAFSTPGSGYANIANAVFEYFDTVEVAEGSLVTLNENLQLLNNAVTKTGKGTLDIYHTNDLDTVMVREGRLRLAANSAQTSMIEHLSVEKGAQLDISKGNSGVNGIVTMAEGSTLVCNINQYAPTVTNVDWQGKVNLWVDGVTPAVAEGGYCIPLFHADAAHGLYQADVTGITLGVVTGIEGLATRADAYVNSVTPGFVTDGAYLVLRDNTLYLTNMEAPARYWLGPSGHWNDTDKVWSQSPSDTGNLTTYEEGARTFFIAQDSTPVEVTLDKDVEAFSVTVRDGAFEFTEGAGDTISLMRGDLVVQNGSALVHPEVKFSEYSGIDVQAGSTLTMDGNRAVTVYNLSNSGDIELGATPLTVKNILQSSGTIHAGNVTLGHGTGQGGTLTAKDVKLGGDTAFTKLTANNVTGNGGYTLTVNGTGESYIKSLDGGSLRVDRGSLVIDQPAATVLTSLQGSGTLTTPGTIILQQPSAIGNLAASGVTVGSTLDVANNLATDSITLQFASLQRPSVTAHDIQSVTPDASVDVHADSSLFTYLYPVEGKEYYLVQAGTSTSSPLTVNGHPDSETVRANRYEYTLSVVNDGVKMNGKIVDYHYYRDQALSENGKSGSDMLDTLFTSDDLEKIQNKSPNGTILQILHRMDQLAQARDKGPLDHLAAAVGGASIAPVSLAFNDDINRQLRAMRNRTTVMGLPACEVHSNLPYVNAWMNAEANFINFGDNGTYSGYDLKSWGGTVGADIDFTNSFTAALAVTAMRGSYQASCAADNCDGDLDTMYVSLMGRYARRAWTHTFVATLGFADVSLDRTVNQAGIQYGTKGDTTGTGFGFMYEVGYTRTIGRRTSLQPVLNFTYAHASIGGYEETGNEAALKVDDMAYNTFTIGAGARIQSATDPDTYENSVLFEGRALLKVITGDTQAQADVAMAAARRAKASMKAEEAGNFGVELGGGVSIPLNSGNSFIFADVSAEIRSGYTNVNGTLGYRINF